MDLIYSRYSNPMELMRLYIENGRFGEWVNETLAAENKRRKEAAEKETEDKLWVMYNTYSQIYGFHGVAPKSFKDWKADVLPNGTADDNGSKDDYMTKEELDEWVTNFIHS